MENRWRILIGLGALLIVDVLQLIIPRIVKHAIDDLTQDRSLLRTSFSMEERSSHWPWGSAGSGMCGGICSSGLPAASRRPSETASSSTFNLSLRPIFRGRRLEI